MTEPTKDGLEKHIDEVSKKIEIPLIKHKTTPGVGNCWYEACASLLRLNNMRNISANNSISRFPDFGSVFPYILNL